MSENLESSDSGAKSPGEEEVEGASSPELRAFEGGQAPPAVNSAWAAYCGYEEPLRRELPQLIRDILVSPNDEANNGRFKAFCSHFKIPNEALSSTIEGLNLLIGQATALALQPDDLRADLLSLGGSEPSYCDPIVELYKIVHPVLRARLVDESLADHGRLLVGVDWRVDELKVSDRGVGLDTSVMHLTLRYREGRETSRISLQLVPEMARRLRDACVRVVGK
jgi:hypothetical protein